MYSVRYLHEKYFRAHFFLIHRVEFSTFDGKIHILKRNPPDVHHPEDIFEYVSNEMHRRRRREIFEKEVNVGFGRFQVLYIHVHTCA